MQEHHWDGSDDLKTLAEELGKAAGRSLGRSETQFVAFHRTGSRVMLQDGTEYEVDEKGTWRKVREQGEGKIQV